MLITAHHTTLPDGAQAPEWLHLVPAGAFGGQDGRGPYSLPNPAAVIAASMAAGKLPVDENHSTDFGLKNGTPSPARGWITEMQARADGLWGRVEWTPGGAALMAEHAYRGISPVFRHTPKGEVLSVLRAALTNAPNLPQLHTLHHQQETGMELASQIRASLGLPETADDAAIVAAVTAGRTAATAHATQLAAIATAAGVTATDGAAIVTALQTQRAAAGDATALQATVVSLQTQLQTMQADGRRVAATAFVDAAIRAGKPIAPARDRFIAQHAADAAATEALINLLPSINDGGTAAHALGGLGGASADDLVARADAWQATQRAKGIDVSNIEAVRHVSNGAAG